MGYAKKTLHSKYNLLSRYNGFSWLNIIFSAYYRCTVLLRFPRVRLASRFPNQQEITTMLHTNTPNKIIWCDKQCAIL